MSIQKAIARAWTDEKFKDKLLTEPHAALSESGVEIPSGTTIKVLEDTPDTQHVVVPVAPAQATELSIDELEKVAGGGPLFPRDAEG